MASENAGSAHDSFVETQRLASQVHSDTDATSQNAALAAQYKAQAAQSAANALFSEQAAKASEIAAQEAQEGAETAEGQAQLYAEQAAADKISVELIKSETDKTAQKITEDKNTVQRLVDDFALAHQQAVADVNNAGQAQTERVENAGEAAVDEIEVTRQQAVESVSDEGTTQKNAVKTEGATQVANVQAVAEEIISDRAQIAENKSGISALKGDLDDCLKVKHLVQGNIVGGSEPISGQLNIQNGEFSQDDSSNWVTYDFEKSEEGITYYFWAKFNGYYGKYNMVIMCAYDANKNLLLAQNTGKQIYFTTPDRTKYVRFSLLKTYVDERSPIIIAKDQQVKPSVDSAYKNDVVVTEYVKKSVYDDFLVTYNNDINNLIQKINEKDTDIITNTLHAENLFDTNPSIITQSGNLEYPYDTEITVDMESTGQTYYAKNLKVNVSKGIYFFCVKVRFDKLGTSNTTAQIVKKSATEPLHMFSEFFQPYYNGKRSYQYLRMTEVDIEEGSYYPIGVFYDAKSDEVIDFSFVVFETNGDATFTYKDMVLINITDSFRADVIDLLVNQPYFSVTDISYSFSGKGAGSLYGKKVAFVGDSITAGVNTNYDDANGIKNTFGYLISKRNSMQYQNYGMGGTTLTYFDNKRYCFSEPDGRYTKIPVENIDILVILFGYNDNAQQGFSIGTIDDETNSTYYGAYNIIMNDFMSRNPKLKIGLITPYGTTKAMRDAIKEIGAKYGFPVLDLYSAEVPMFYERDSMTSLLSNISANKKKAFLADGVHPNYDGHTFLASIIESFIARL